MAVRRKARRLSVARILQVALPTALLLMACFIGLQFLWLRNAPWGAPPKSYAEFELDVRNAKVKSATVDGNIIRALYEGQLSTVVTTPSAQRSVDLMIKSGVAVEAYQAVPASGLSLPVLALALLPYPILAYFALGLMSALGSGADFGETEALLAAEVEPPPAPKVPLPHALDDSIEAKG